MKKQTKHLLAKNLVLHIFFSLLFLLLSLFFVFLFVNCIQSHSLYDIGYDDVLREELTFERYEEIHRLKGGSSIEIYFEEYETPFLVSSITRDRVNLLSLKKLTAQEKVQVCYRESKTKNYEYSICELQSNSNVILSLSNYIKANQSNQIIGMIICLILALSSLGLSCYFVVSFFVKNGKKK